MLWRLAVGNYEYNGVRLCNLPVLYTYKASECKRAIIRLHCKSSLWNTGYVDSGGAFECPHIYRTNEPVHQHERFFVDEIFHGETRPNSLNKTA